MEWYDPRTVIYAWFLESHFRLAQGMLYNPVYSNVKPILSERGYSPGTVAFAVAILSFMGAYGRAGPAREHGALHGEQLLAAWILALVAPLVQPLDCALPLHSARWGA